MRHEHRQCEEQQDGKGRGRTKLVPMKISIGASQLRASRDEPSVSSGSTGPTFACALQKRHERARE